ncbi:MAG TPA: helicase-associated domain-containing protein [Gemmatales bacterium]|nr:helicase-associated domain-containing protein [Gemmatales bacterium]HMP61087.1 helicase-associated domain-containing protein [Gemmatales bacterium]
MARPAGAPRCWRPNLPRHVPNLSSDDQATSLIQGSLERCSPALVKQLARHLVGGQVDRSEAKVRTKLLAAYANPVLIDRALRKLPAAALEILMMAHVGHRSAWAAVDLLSLHGLLQQTQDTGVLRELIERGLLLPAVSESETASFSSPEEVLLASLGRGVPLLCPPAVLSRVARWREGGLPPPAELIRSDELAPREADGLEVLLRMGALWQEVAEAPLRLTQGRSLFKKCQQRLQQPLLAERPGALVEIADFPRLVLEMAVAEGLLQIEDMTVGPGSWSEVWSSGDLVECLRRLWADTTSLDYFPTWSDLEFEGPLPIRSHAPLMVLALAVLHDLPPEGWTPVPSLARWFTERGLTWSPNDGTNASGNVDRFTAGLEAFLAGWAWELRLTQTAVRQPGEVLVRLSPLGRAILSLSSVPPGPEFPKTLLVQPNLEIIAYRQGLNPALIAELSKCARWTSLGSACTLRLEPATVYRGMEAGLTLDRLEQLLQAHGSRELPAPVQQALRTWAGKRERLSLYRQAVLVEFTSVADLEAAQGRGLAGQRITDRLLLVAHESELDLQRLRILANRDYRQPPDVCVRIAEDGVTLTVDRAKSDLLLEAELERFAEPSPDTGLDVRQYRLTPASLARASASGWGDRPLEEWFQRRCGCPLPATVRLLRGGGDGLPLNLAETWVLHTPTVELAEALWQWPATRVYLQARLGPTTLAVVAAERATLMQQLADLGWSITLPTEN